MSGILLLIFCIFSSTSASICLKKAAGLGARDGLLATFVFNPMIIAGILCYAASFIAYFFALQKVRLSVAQPVITSGVSIVTVFVALVIFKEPMSMLNWIGLTLISVGIVFLSVGKI